MSRIHDKSKTITVPELDIFQVPPTQDSIEKTYFTHHRPFSTLAANQQIQINFSSALDEYINLRDMYFYIKVQVDLMKVGDVAADDWKKINPVNNTLHSMFKYVDLEIANKSVVQSPQTYAYKAYLENLLGFSEFAKTGYLTAEGWDMNFEKHLQSVDEELSKELTPSTIATSGTGVIKEFYGKLHIDLAMQPKSIIGGCKYTLTLIPNNPNFWHYGTEANVLPAVKFLEAALYVSRSKIAPHVVDAQNRVLTNTTAKYPIMRGVVKSFPIPSGFGDVKLDNAIVGQVPRRAFIMFVDSRGFNGDYKYNPLNFEHFNLTYLSASIDGEQYPAMPFQPDYDKDLYVREFMALYDVLNQSTTDTGVTISKKEFKKGLAIYAINFGPDNIDECTKQGYLNKIRYAAVNFNAQFSPALSQNVHALIYCEYDNMIEILPTREPKLDYP